MDKTNKAPFRPYESLHASFTTLRYLFEQLEWLFYDNPQCNATLRILSSKWRLKLEFEAKPLYRRDCDAAIYNTLMRWYR